jgi:A/G-specific adenine glycosylase
MRGSKKPIEALAGKPCEDLAGTIARCVVSWFRRNGRDFPWRRTSDCFHILVAEVLLRHTQAYRVVEPFLELVGRYPDPYALALADRDDLRTWFKPLGLVKRADWLIEASQIIVSEHGGQVPREIGALLRLPGIGVYSASAVLCLGFGMPVPMIDEGSGRILRRILGLPSRGPAHCDRSLVSTAGKIMPRTASREFNLGLLDIAAAYCHSRDPSCSGCPLAHLCEYREQG